MMKKAKHKLTLDRPATYQIKVPGHLDESWSDWAGGMTITVESDGEGPPVTTLTGPSPTRLLCRVCCGGSIRWVCH